LEARTPWLVLLAAAWLGGLLLGFGGLAGGEQGWGALAALGIAIGLAAHHRLLSDTGGSPRVALLWLALAALVAGATTQTRPRPVPPAPAGLARIEGDVLGVSHKADGTARSVLRVISGIKVEDRSRIEPGTVLAIAPMPLPDGARVRLLAQVAPRVPFRNLSPHPPWPQRFEPQGRAWLEGAGAIEVIEQPWLSERLERGRAHVRGALHHSLPPSAAGIARALVLGEGNAVAPEDAGLVRDAGLLHVLAVSGLHVAILAGAFVWLLGRALRYTRLAAAWEVHRIACAAGVPAALLYAAFAGGAPSAWRAAVTAAIAWSVRALGRRPDPAACGALAVLVLGTLDPAEATRPAFLLSVVATAAIVGAHDEAPAIGLRAWLSAALRLSVRTALATAPLVLWCFGSLPWVGVLANVWLLPLGSLVLVQLAAVHALLASCGPPGALSAPLFALASDGFVAACGLFARLAPSSAWPPLDLPQGITLALTAAALLWLRSARRRWLSLLLGVCTVLAFELRLRANERPRDQLRVSFLDVGQGDAALIDLPDGRAMLIDAGGNPGGGPDPGAWAVAPLLRARRRDHLDWVVLTHPHPDHYGGLNAILEQVSIGELWDNGQGPAEADLNAPSAEAARLIERARTAGARVRGPAELCGRPLRAGAARIEVLAPCPRHDPAYDANDNSLVLRIDYGQRSFLFAGDAEAHAEAMLVGSAARLRADVLKVAHHGSRTSSTPAFLRAVAPRLAVVSAGATNRFGHPHVEVIDRLRAQRVRTLTLGDEGGTIVRSDGRRLEVETWAGTTFSL
jgi:competence protein ComEC